MTVYFHPSDYYDVDPECNYYVGGINYLSEWTCEVCNATNYTHGCDVVCHRCLSMELQGRDLSNEPSHKLGRLLMSKGEARVAEVLEDLSITFETEHIFDSCIDKKPLRFDFYLPDHRLLIEFDGEQHFRPVKWSKNMDSDAAIARLERVQRRDSIKDTWAKENNYELLRISYKEFEHIEKLITFWTNI